MKTVMLVFGTRPEAIKLCPLVNALKERGDQFRVVTCVTAQHREMLDQVLSVFRVKPDYDLNLMKKYQSLSDLTARLLTAVDEVLEREQVDILLVQGDTTTTFATALAAYYHRIPVGHVEAGLRTGNKFSPYPEEINRKLTTAIADIHFAPTAANRQNLLAEGVPESAIHVTGNTVIDALLWVRELIRAEKREFPELAGIDFGKRVIVVTGHRRESFGPGFVSLCNALRDIAASHPEVQVIYPVHLNPNVRRPVLELLSGLPNVTLLEPLDYEPFVNLMDKSFFIITDSGGVQEEAPSLGKPVLVARNTTERPEALTSGGVRLVGTDRATIVREAERLLTDPGTYTAMSLVQNPYGDGRACNRIVAALDSTLVSRRAGDPLSRSS
jgi:UDP-N-acetylglucosamine 2-epimerase (non-hydrolysing)